jgi:ankyrin repeat protein
MRQLQAAKPCAQKIPFEQDAPMPFSAISRPAALAAVSLILAALGVIAPATAQTLGKDHPVFTAVRQDSKTFATYINRYGVSLRVATANGETLMHFAAQCQDGFSNVGVLKRAGLDPNARNAQGATPLMQTRPYAMTGALRRCTIWLSTRA